MQSFGCQQFVVRLLLTAMQSITEPRLRLRSARLVEHRRALLNRNGEEKGQDRMSKVDKLIPFHVQNAMTVATF
jgi:hypothetical protein